MSNCGKMYDYILVFFSWGDLHYFWLQLDSSNVNRSSEVVLSQDYTRFSLVRLNVMRLCRNQISQPISILHDSENVKAVRGVVRDVLEGGNTNVQKRLTYCRCCNIISYNFVFIKEEKRTLLKAFYRYKRWYSFSLDWLWQRFN